MTRFVVATVINIQGSAPREVGAKILISADEILGTIGGGRLEYQVMQTAREFLASDKPAGFSHQQNYILGTEMGQCCGGQVAISYQLTDNAELWQDPLQASNQQFTIVLFGAGHVGQALVSILATQPCHVHWVDSRSELFPATLPANVISYTPNAPASLVSEMPANSYFLVMTHDHALDLEICDHVLARQDTRFIGLIGSATKAARFRSQLLRRGLTPQDIERLTCPIGISGIASKLPSSIAVAVAAQLLGLQEDCKHPHPNPSPTDVLIETALSQVEGLKIKESTHACLPLTLSGRGGRGVRVQNLTANHNTKTVPHPTPLPQPFPHKGGRELNRLTNEIHP